MSVDTRVVVDLGGFEGLALIVPGATGVIYEQQGCNMHHRRRMEGFLVPILVHLPPPCDIANQLTLYFDGPKWWGECCWGIDEETAVIVNESHLTVIGKQNVHLCAPARKNGAARIRQLQPGAQEALQKLCEGLAQ